MAKYIPSPNGIKYCYIEDTGSEKIMIRSSWSVELSANENIIVHDTVQIGANSHFVLLEVSPTGGPANDHTWAETIDIPICNDVEYDPVVTTVESEKQKIVRIKILNLLLSYNASEFQIVTLVKMGEAVGGNRGSETISGSGVIDIGLQD